MIDVLLVDDAREIEVLARATLAGRAALRVCRDRAAARAAFAAGPAEVVLIDLVLDGESGFDVLTDLRGLPGGPAARMLAVSACADRADVDRTRAAGFDGHLAKPLTRAQLDLALGLATPAVQVPSYLTDLVPEFLSGVTALAETARVELARGGWIDVARVGHRLAGSAAIYGFPTLVARGRALERAAQAADPGAAATLIEEIDADAARPWPLPPEPPR